ncbi:MAG TPA: SpoIIE family protein phosphatase [Anaerolineae bacterium]
MMRGFGLLKNATDHQFYPAGQVIFQEGQPGDVMYVVIDGEVSVTVEGRPIDHLVPGSVFGEMALVDDRPRSATATAATDCNLVVIDHERFASLVQQFPDFALQVMNMMSFRLRRLLDDEIKRQRLEEELAIGRQIQLSLLPERCPDVPGWEFAAFYRSARQVGGDLYDFIASADEPHRLGIVIADVTGKGVPAALFMAFSRTILRAESRTSHSPATILRRANQFILQDIRYRLFLSAFYATLDTRSGRLVYANGGHDWPLWLRASSGEVETLAAPGLLLGVFQDVRLEEREVEVAPGDFLIFYTDGLTEARNAAGQFFGEDRLRETLTAAGATKADQLLQNIVNAVADFTGATPQADDFTLVVVRRAARESIFAIDRA